MRGPQYLLNNHGHRRPLATGWVGQGAHVHYHSILFMCALEHENTSARAALFRSPAYHAHQCPPPSWAAHLTASQQPELQCARVVQWLVAAAPYTLAGVPGRADRTAAPVAPRRRLRAAITAQLCRAGLQTHPYAHPPAHARGARMLFVTAHERVYSACRLYTAHLEHDLVLDARSDECSSC